jgi:hypothetical protein
MSMTVASQPVPGTEVGIGVGALVVGFKVGVELPVPGTEVGNGVGALVVGCKVGAELVGQFVELKFGAPVGLADGASVSDFTVGFKLGVELPVPGTEVGNGVGTLVVGCKVGAELVGRADGASVSDFTVGFKVGVELSSDWHVSSIVYSPT